MTSGGQVRLGCWYVTASINATLSTLEKYNSDFLFDIKALGGVLDEHEHLVLGRIVHPELELLIYWDDVLFADGGR